MANHNITKKMCEETAIFKYLCPSLLSADEILTELRKRGIVSSGLDQKSRDELIQIFTQHVMPLPQRTFPNNHQGKLINEMIQKENTSSPRKTEKHRLSLQFGFINEKKEPPSTFINSGSSLSTSGCRLKPPIDLTEVTSKKISLAKNLPSSTCLDKVVIKDRTKERKMSTDSPSQNNADMTMEEEKVELKRPHSPTKESEDRSPSKKARQHIAWP